MSEELKIKTEKTDQEPAKEETSEEPEIILPSNWETEIIEKKVVEGEDKFRNVRVHLFANIRTREEFKKWLEEFQNITGTSYVIKCTEIIDGERIMFKQRLVCHHFTKCKKTYDPSLKNKTRNTNCPSKLHVKIYTVRKRYRGKLENYDLIRKMPCQMILFATHNHSTDSADFLKMRKVSSEARQQLINLYENGHSPGTALRMLKYQLQMNDDNNEKKMADRSQCPNYKYCYDLFKKEFKGKPKFSSEDRIFLLNKLELYNEQQGDVCAKVEFIGHDGSDYVVGISTPIMKRIHKHMENASEVVYMDSSGTVERDGRIMYILLTDSECGALPLGLIITTTESIEAIINGFQILKELVGENIFGGHQEGPKVFMTDDSLAQIEAVGNVWPESARFLSNFHVLLAVYKWLSNQKNGIPRGQRISTYKDFRNILYSDNLNDMVKNYELALANKQKCAGYIHYLNTFWWPRKESWVKAYKNVFQMYSINTNMFAESAIRQIRLEIISRVKAFNIVQMADFTMTKFEEYIEKKLLDAASDHLKKTPVYRDFKMPSMEVVERISIVDENIIAVPSESKRNIMNTVNTEILLCSCIEGNGGIICKHVDWANALHGSSDKISVISDDKIREKLLCIATGRIPKYEPSSREGSSSPTIEVEIDCSLFPDGSDAEYSLEHFIKNNDSEIRKKYKDTMKRMIEMFDTNFEKAPLEVVTSVEQMLENLGKIKEPEEFSSAIASVAIGKGRKRRKLTLTG